jgi:hypothetical protein
MAKPLKDKGLFLKKTSKVPFLAQEAQTKFYLFICT